MFWYDLVPLLSYVFYFIHFKCYSAQRTQRLQQTTQRVWGMFVRMLRLRGPAQGYQEGFEPEA